MEARVSFDRKKGSSFGEKLQRRLHTHTVRFSIFINYKVARISLNHHTLIGNRQREREREGE